MYRLGKDVHVFQEKWVLTIIDQELIYMHVLFRLQYYHIWSTVSKGYNCVLLKGSNNIN